MVRLGIERGLGMERELGLGIGCKGVRDKGSGKRVRVIRLG